MGGPAANGQRLRRVGTMPDKKYRRRPDQVSYSAQVYCLGLLGSPPDPVHSVAVA